MRKPMVYDVLTYGFLKEGQMGQMGHWFFKNSLRTVRIYVREETLEILCPLCPLSPKISRRNQVAYKGFLTLGQLLQGCLEPDRVQTCVPEGCSRHCVRDCFRPLYHQVRR